MVGSATLRVGALCFLTGLMFPAQLVAQSLEDHVSPSDFGGIGLLQTRTARFGPDGLFNFGASRVEPYDRVYLNVHILPRLEATFRYLSVTNIPFQFEGEEGTFLDRGADLKLKILDERKYVPALAVGFQDTIGTGLFSSEYIVASKRYYDLDFSFGLAWGYPNGSRGTFENPLTAFSDRFRTRDADIDQGGKLGLGNFFSGERVALFGGVEYRTPIKGLTLKLEYDPNDYRAEPLGNRFEQDLPFNFGLNYRPYSWIEGSLGFERGNTLMARLALRSELHELAIPKFLDPSLPPLKPRPPTAAAAPAGAAAPARSAARGVVAPAPIERELAASARRAPDRALWLFEGIEAAGLSVESVELNGSAAVIGVAARATDDAGPALERAALAAAAALPADAESIEFRLETPGRRPLRRRFRRRDIEARAVADDLFDGLERQGFEVRTVELSEGRATVRVSTSRLRLDNDYRRALRAVADRLPMPLDEVTVIASRQGAEETSVTLHLAQGTGGEGSASGSEEGRPADEQGPAPAPAPSDAEIAARLFEELEAEGFSVDAFHLDGVRATVFATPRRYPQAARNIGRAARVVANNAPAGVEEITVVTMNAGIETSRVTVLRKDLENAAAFKGSPEEIWANATIEGGGDGVPGDAITNPERYPSFSWSLRPTLRQHVGAPENPYLFQIWARLGARFEPFRGVSITGVAGRDIYNNFDKIKRGSKGTLPPVRSNLREYLQQGESNLVRLHADYIFSPARNWYARLSAGIFEEMFGGVGGEILYRPLASRWAFGLDVNWVRQRDFDQLLDFRDYSVTTGHFNIYYQMPFYDLLGSIHVGQYLAGDRGATFQLSRRFDSGITVGAFVTLTNVSAEEFGEGSFDKGFFFIIPFDVFLPRSTRSKAVLGFRPLTSDGGQMLNLGYRLYGLTGEAALNHIARDWSAFGD